MQSGMNIKTIGAVVLVGLLMSCDTTDKGMTKTHDITGEYVDIRVMTFSTQRQLNKYLKRKDGEEVEGLAQWAHPKGDLTKVKRCDIYVVEPNSSRDYGQMETWGHELMHCIYGSYHPEGQR